MIVTDIRGSLALVSDLIAPFSDPVALVGHPFAFIGATLALVKVGVQTLWADSVRRAGLRFTVRFAPRLALVGGVLALIRDPLALVRGTLALGRDPLALVGPLVSVVCATLSLVKLPRHL